jgi:hypothetical protein
MLKVVFMTWPVHYINRYCNNVSIIKDIGVIIFDADTVNSRNTVQLSSATKA